MYSGFSFVPMLIRSFLSPFFALVIPASHEGHDREPNSAPFLLLGTARVWVGSLDVLRSLPGLLHVFPAFFFPFEAKRVRTTIPPVPHKSKTFENKLPSGAIDSRVPPFRSGLISELTVGRSGSLSVPFESVRLRSVATGWRTVDGWTCVLEDGDGSDFSFGTG